MPRYILVKKSASKKAKARHGYKRSTYPFVHKAKETALVEAMRLASYFDSTVCIYEEIAAIAPPLNQEVEVSRG